MAESDSIPQTEEEWRGVLTEEEYRVLREKGTEPKFSGEFLDDVGEGEFRCKGCGALLFDSDVKFGSGTGWPSFYDAVEGSVEFERDTSHGMVRTEVLCANCDGHLGHVFEDGPDPTGKRYCINSVCLEFDPDE